MHMTYISWKDLLSFTMQKMQRGGQGPSLILPCALSNIKAVKPIKFLSSAFLIPWNNPPPLSFSFLVVTFKASKQFLYTEWRNDRPFFHGQVTIWANKRTLAFIQPIQSLDDIDRKYNTKQILQPWDKPPNIYHHYIQILQTPETPTQQWKKVKNK